MRETESTPNEKFLMEENQALRTKIKEMSLMLGFKKIEYSPIKLGNELSEKDREVFVQNVKDEMDKAISRMCNPPPFPNQDEGHIA